LKTDISNVKNEANVENQMENERQTLRDEMEVRICFRVANYLGHLFLAILKRLKQETVLLIDKSSKKTEELEKENSMLKAEIQESKQIEYDRFEATRSQNGELSLRLSDLNTQVDSLKQKNIELNGETQALQEVSLNTNLFDCIILFKKFSNFLAIGKSSRRVKQLYCQLSTKV
jgi:hypothetical protein